MNWGGKPPAPSPQMKLSPELYETSAISLADDDAITRIQSFRLRDGLDSFTIQTHAGFQLYIPTSIFEAV